jgi:hypothetical protein
MRQKVKLNLNPRQVRSLSEKAAVIVKPDQVRDDGEHEIDISVVKHRKMMRNKGKNKGYRLRLDETEGGAFLQNISGRFGLKRTYHPKRISSQARDLWKAGKQSKLMRSPPPVLYERRPQAPQYTMYQHTIGGGISLPFTKENLIKASDPLINVGDIYFDHSRFIRPNQPAFHMNRVSEIQSVGSWI